MPDFMKILQQAQEMQGRFQKIQDELAAADRDGSAGGGMVTAEVNGTGQIKKIKLDPSVVNPADVEMLEDLVVVAVSDAQKKAQELRAGRDGQAHGGMKLPFKLPVLSARAAVPAVTRMSAIDDLATELSRLPGIGRKTALRLTYHLLRQPPEQSAARRGAASTLGERVRPCARCFNLTEDELCSICRDPRRDAAIDLRRRAGVGHRRDRARGRVPRAVPRARRTAVAARRRRPGRPHHRARCVERVDAQARAVREVILATNPSLEGEATALYVQRQLAPRGVTVSRIARGLPVGGDLEYADGVTIAQALSARRACERGRTTDRSSDRGLPRRSSIRSCRLEYPDPAVAPRPVQQEPGQAARGARATSAAARARDRAAFSPTTSAGSAPALRRRGRAPPAPHASSPRLGSNRDARWRSELVVHRRRFRRDHAVRCSGFSPTATRAARCSSIAPGSSWRPSASSRTSTPRRSRRSPRPTSAPTISSRS